MKSPVSKYVERLSRKPAGGAVSTTQTHKNRGGDQGSSCSSTDQVARSYLKLTKPIMKFKASTFDIETSRTNSSRNSG